MVGVTRGGVLKSGLNLMIALEAMRRGLRVAYIDGDAQANSSMFLAKPDLDFRKVKTFYDVVRDEKQAIEYLIPSKFEGIDFLPSTARLRKVIPLTDNANPKTLFANKVTEIKKSGEYDLLIVDTSPSLPRYVVSAFLNADDVILPCDNSLFTLESLAMTKAELEEVAEDYDAKKPKFHIVRNRFTTHKTSSKDISAELYRDFADILLPDIVIRETTHIPNSFNNLTDPLIGAPSHLKTAIEDLADKFLGK
jgi:cellulose biosynthesis protein BcsQ